MDFLHVINQINYVIAHSSSQWWVIPMVSLFCLIDGFFLFLPSETAIVALASISLRTGHPNIWFLMIGAAVGAMIGDNIAYFLGNKLGTSRFKWMRKPKGAKAFSWAGRELEKRGAILIFTARYIPVGRIAVNFTAGATRFPWRRFVALDGIAVVTWVAYSALVGRIAGRWVHHNPLLGVAIAIAFAIVIGFIVDHAMKLVHNQLEKRGRLAPRLAPGAMAAELAARVLAEAQALHLAPASGSAGAADTADDTAGAGDAGTEAADAAGADADRSDHTDHRGDADRHGQADRADQADQADKADRHGDSGDEDDVRDTPIAHGNSKN